MIIAGRQIGREHKPFIIAEMSGNHNQSLERALDIVRAAAESGVDALKIQTYTADTMTLEIAEGDFFISDEKSLWKGKSLHELYKQAYTPWEWHQTIFGLCKELGLIAFSTPFDRSAVRFLESLDVPCYKIASFENNYLDLIRAVAETRKPVIISTGLATLSELDETVRAARDAGCKDLVLLKCTSSYPASPENSNLRTIPHLRELFSSEVGLSDHTGGIGAAVASIALGGSVIEKHFTLRRADGGVDASFSLEPEEMASLVRECDRAWRALGQVVYGPTAEEKKSVVYRRSLYISRNLRRGESLTRDSVRVVRPGFGLAPRYENIVIGKRVTRDVEKGTPVTWDLIE